MLKSYIASILCFLFIAISPAQGRNIVMLISDDHSPQAGYLGSDDVQTPNLDRLADMGVSFSRAYSCVASCAASRSVIYTGMFNHSNGQFGHAHSVYNFQTHSWVESLPKLLNDAGYNTGLIGKFHVNTHEIYPFDTLIEGVESWPLNVGPFRGNRNVAVMADSARKFIEDSGDDPFLLVMGYSDPHRGSGPGGFSNFTDYDARITPVTYKPEDVNVPWWLPDAPEVRQEITEYFTAVSRMDQGVGMILDILQESGKMDDTMIIYTSDNGMAFVNAKTNLYGPGVHMPFLVYTPNLKKRGATNNAMISFIDLVPTILDWADAPGPKEYDLPGRSFLPVIERENPRGWNKVYVSHTFHETPMYYPMRGIRTDKYLYLMNVAHQLPFPHAADLWISPTWRGVVERGDRTVGPRTVAAYNQRPREELYDLTKDPQEGTNVAGDPTYAEVLEEMRTDLKQWRTDTKDPWIVKYDHE
jgi:N-sulfoglucosamine sulfohydrolase